MKKYILMLFALLHVVAVGESSIGVYDLDVNISGNAYRDILTITTIDSNGHITGSFEVPKVFKVPVSGRAFQKVIMLSFLAKERGREFRVDLKGKLKLNCKITGKLLQDGVVFAHFVGQKRGCNE